MANFFKGNKPPTAEEIAEYCRDPESSGCDVEMMDQASTALALALGLARTRARARARALASAPHSYPRLFS